MRTVPPARHCDGVMVYIFVQTGGTSGWIQRLTTRGRCCDFGLGSGGLVSLDDFRHDDEDETPAPGAAPPLSYRDPRRGSERSGGVSPFVFTKGDGKPLYEKPLRWLLRMHEIAAVLHGFRSIFQD